MVASILASGTSDDQKDSARKTHAEYEATFGLPEPVVEVVSRGVFRLRGTSLLFTYNWEFCTRALPDGTPPFASTSELWKEWRKCKAEAKQRLGVKLSSR